MNSVLALQELAIEADAFGGLEQSQATQGPECSYGSIHCVPYGAVEASYRVI